jgi:aminoglycoside 3-N-acetyltransferase I
MPATPRIQQLTPADLPLLRQLNAVFAEAFNDAPSCAGTLPDDAYCRRILAQQPVIVLVAQVQGAVVGGLVAYELPKLEQARSEIYLYDLAVAQAHRRRGIATGLIVELCALARQRGAWAVFVQADHGDDPAIALYEKLGVREEVLHFDLNPPAVPGEK